jgi:hypothetical protein
MIISNCWIFSRRGKDNTKVQIVLMMTYTVLLQAMKEDPAPDAKCRDKFLVQSVAVSADKEFNNVRSPALALHTTFPQRTAIAVQLTHSPLSSGPISSKPINPPFKRRRYASPSFPLTRQPHQQRQMVSAMPSKEHRPIAHHHPNHQHPTTPRSQGSNRGPQTTSPSRMQRAAQSRIARLPSPMPFLRVPTMSRPSSLWPKRRLRN